MARLQFARPFLEELSLLDEAAEQEVWRKLELVGRVPGVGSSLVEPMLRTAFGNSCLKIAAAGYDVLYERVQDGEEEHATEEIVRVLGIVAQRRVR